MTFQEIADKLKGIATTTAPGATFHRGRRADTSLKSIDAETDLIFVEDTIEVRLLTDVGTEPWTIRMGFFRQDSPESEPMESNNQSGTEARDTIFTTTLATARAYFEQLQTEVDWQFTSEPVLRQGTRILAGTFTGWVAEFTFLNVKEC